MNVKALVERLQQMDPEAQVAWYDGTQLSGVGRVVQVKIVEDQFVTLSPYGMVIPGVAV